MATTDRHQWRVAVWDIREFSPEGGYSQDMDFRIKGTGKNDVVIQMVRLSEH